MKLKQNYEGSSAQGNHFSILLHLHSSQFPVPFYFIEINMPTASIHYLGELRTEATHNRSGEHITTDAPVDNNGKGERFSPTDLVASALVSCMITVMGIKARDRNWDMGELSGDVEKIMASAPRRISGLNVVLRFKNHNLSASERKVLEQVAMTCPVAKSLNADIQMPVRFEYD